MAFKLPYRNTTQLEQLGVLKYSVVCCRLHAHSESELMSFLVQGLSYVSITTRLQMSHNETGNTPNKRIRA